MYGTCGSCGFPVLLKNTTDSVKCPFCEKANTPISGTSISPAWVILAAALGVLVLSKGRAKT